MGKKYQPRITDQLTKEVQAIWDRLDRQTRNDWWADSAPEHLTLIHPLATNLALIATLTTEICQYPEIYLNHDQHVDLLEKYWKGPEIRKDGWELNKDTEAMVREMNLHPDLVWQYLAEPITAQ